MPRSKHLNLRAIHIDSPGGVKRVRISVRNDLTRLYETFEVNSHAVLNKYTLEAFIRQQYHDQETGVTFPVWLK